MTHFGEWLELLAAAKAIVKLHDDLAVEVDREVIDAAFERWDAAVTRLFAAIDAIERKATP